MLLPFTHNSPISNLQRYFDKVSSVSDARFFVSVYADSLVLVHVLMERAML